MVTGVVAEPGKGKSAFVLHGIVRVIVTGVNWFTGTLGTTPGYVLWCGTENDLAINLQRMRDWQIPMERVILPFKDDTLAAVDLSNDLHLKLIEALVNRYKTPAVIVDSLRGGHDGDENSSRVGRVLQSLSGIAERTNAAIIVVHHTLKMNSDEEMTASSSRGSNAIVANMRALIGIDRPDPNSKWCRVRVLKENLGIRPTPIGFQVSDKGLEYGPAPAKPRKQSEVTNCEDWLRQRLQPGQSVNANEILAEAEQLGHHPRNIQRAVERLQIRPQAVRQAGRIAGWLWTMPAANP